MLRILICLSFVCFIPCSWASPHWYTLETNHFNVHFTKGHEDWAQSAAKELEVIRQVFLAQQQRSLPVVADVVIFDPYHGANGFALPSTDNPLMALFTTPPQSDTVISNSRSWLQLLILHEYAHLVHLSQVSRHSWRQRLRDLWDVYDLASAMMPRWVAEGYATLLESKMTGRGRLYDNYSEAILIQFARAGALPSYERLNGGDHSYLSNTMAYLLGSRFLAWLEEQYSEERLDMVWTRMRAVKQRDFKDAFNGVYEAPVDVLYRRFIAEYTYKAMQSRVIPSDEGALWMKAAFSANSPALSMDKTRLALVEQTATGYAYLNVYATEENHEAAQLFSQQQLKLLKNDPQDIADRAPEVFQRERLYQLPARNGAIPRYPQWLDNDTILFVAVVRNEKKRHKLSGELFRWTLSSGEVTQLTQRASIRRFSVGHDQQTIYAEQVEYGYSKVIKITLPSPQFTVIAAQQFGRVYDFPVLANNSDKLAYLTTGLNDNWQLVVKDLTSRDESIVPMPDGYQYLTQPHWASDDNAIFFVAGVSSQLAIYRYDFQQEQLYKVTEGQKLVAYPIEMSDDLLLFITTTAQGSHLWTQPIHNEQPISDMSVEQVTVDLSEYMYKVPDAKMHNARLPSKVYEPWPSSASLAMGMQYTSSDDKALLHFGIKGSDLLAQFSWHIGGTQDVTRDEVSGFFADLRYQHGDFSVRSKLFDMNVALPNSAVKVNTYHDFTGGFLELSQAYQGSRWMIRGHIAANVSEGSIGEDTSHQHWQRMGVQHHWYDDHQAFSLGSRLSWDWYEGEVAQRSWQGYDFDFKIFGKAFNYPGYVRSIFQMRDTVPLRLGGMQSILFDHHVLANWITIPELPLTRLHGQQYQRFDLGGSWREGRPWLYYQRHLLDQHWVADSYGLKFSQVIEHNSWLGTFAPAGVSDIRVDFGVARLVADELENENRVWFGVWYAL